MKTILMITVDEVKKKGYVNQNVESNTIATTIVRVQDSIIKDLIGRKYFNVLLDRIENGSLNNNDRVLLDEYISKCIVSAVDYKILDHLRMETRAKGVIEASDQFGSNASFENTNKLRLSNKGDFEHYREELQHFLCANKDKYPDHIGRCHCSCNKNRIGSTYVAPIYM